MKMLSKIKIRIKKWLIKLWNEDWDMEVDLFGEGKPYEDSAKMIVFQIMFCLAIVMLFLGVAGLIIYGLLKLI